MVVHRSIEDLDAAVPSAVTMGTYDGVHLGHVELLRTVHAISRDSGIRSVLITFDPHPREVIGTDGHPLFLLTTVDERVELIEKEGVDACVVLPFTRSLSLLSAREFFESVIVKKSGARHVVVGFDHKFGHGRGADITELKTITLSYGIGTTIVPALTIEGLTVSSTEIRRALSRGDIRRANSILGRAYSFRGIVERGEGVGRSIGVATANIKPESERKMLPSDGVYAVTVHIGERSLRAVMNIGTRPTFSDTQNRAIEVHLLDFDEEIYGRYLRVEVRHRLRDEKKYPSSRALLDQIERDITQARTLLSE